MVDEKWHWLWANEILNKSFWGEGAYFRAPLYPYFLALLVKMASGSIFWAKFLQVLLCGPTAYLIYKLADRLLNRSTAILAGFIYAFYGLFLFYDTMFLIPVLFIPLLVWGMYRLVAYQDSVSWKTWLVTGVVFGLAALARPNVLLVVPFLMLWMVFRSGRQEALIKRLRLPLMMAVGLVIAIAPVTIRNVAVTGEFMLISSQGGINLYLGNNASADGLTMLMPEVDLDESVPWDRFTDVTKGIAERESGQSLSEGEQSSFWRRKAVGFIVENPGQFVKLVFKKTVYLLSGFENSDNADIYYQRTKSVLYSILVWEKPIYFPFGLLLPLTFVGIFMLRSQSRELFPIYVFLLSYIPSIVLFLVTARHRLPLLPFMIILASGGLVALVRQRKTLGGKGWSIVGALFVIPLLLFNFTYFDLGRGSDFQIHFNNGIRFEQLGDYAEAETEYRLADAIFPYSAPLVNNLAFAQFQVGRFADANRNYHRAIAIDRTYAPPYNNLGLLVQKQGKLDSAQTLFQTAVRLIRPELARPNELSQYYLNIADVLEKKKQYDSASGYYEEALKAGPEYYKAYFRGAAFYARIGSHEMTDTLYTHGMRLHDMAASDFFNWGLSFMERRQYSMGISLMLRALKRDESLYQAYYAIAVGYYESGYPRDSVQTYLERCFAYNPGYEPALELLETISSGR